MDKITDALTEKILKDFLHDYPDVKREDIRDYRMTNTLKIGTPSKTVKLSHYSLFVILKVPKNSIDFFMYTPHERIDADGQA